MYENRYPYVPKTVLITGATGDFGKAFAERFADLGANLVLVGRSQDKIDSLAHDLKDRTSGSVVSLVFDIADKQAMESAVASLPADLSVDLLINNAGLALGLEPAQDCDIDDWETMIDVNNRALIRMTRSLLPAMVENKCGHIINIGSTAGNYPYPGGNVYGATKAFVKMFSMNLRADLKGTNVRVTNIEPGAIETQFSKVRFKGDVDRANSVYANTANMHAEDVAEAIVWTATLPPYFNVNRMEIMPTAQTFAGLVTERFD